MKGVPNPYNDFKGNKTKNHFSEVKLDFKRILDAIKIIWNDKYKIKNRFALILSSNKLIFLQHNKSNSSIKIKEEHKI